ncbi:helix-turn-helix domain-containing protein [Papillibacter cinnamivorans]|uniref:helix-turn-helix domain-containing protein n=1 Tax=Papillibacter cinnamivorans TaxID=100176 RepID=UPI001FA85A42|nr:helix-turn-helix transcriptional regulator [Papillibacter cinnamivorans]
MRHLNTSFSRTLSLLRQERGISQRAAAGDLEISQALLSHYENGIREPGLAFVLKACDYYGVSSDYLLGRTLSRDGTTIAAEELYDYSTEKDNVLHGSILATLNKKLLVNSTCVIFDLLSSTGNREAILEASAFLETAIYKLFRDIYRAGGNRPEGYFSIVSDTVSSSAADGDMLMSEARFIQLLARSARGESGVGEIPPVSNDALARSHPVMFQSLLQVLHSTDERVAKAIDK